MPETLEQKRAALKTKQAKELKQLDAKIRDAKARETSKERKKDTRRKVIAGALALNHLEKNPTSEFGKKLVALIEEYTLDDRSRALFDLEPLPEHEQQSRKASQAQERKKANDIL